MILELKTFKLKVLFDTLLYAKSFKFKSIFSFAKKNHKFMSN